MGVKFDFYKVRIHDYDTLQDFSFSPHIETPECSETIEIQSQYVLSCLMKEIK